VLSALKEHQWAPLNVLCLFTLCSSHVSALVVVLSDSPYERIRQQEACPILKEDRSLVQI
jgi:hypothetical protein